MTNFGLVPGPGLSGVLREEYCSPQCARDRRGQTVKVGRTTRAALPETPRARWKAGEMPFATETRIPEVASAHPADLLASLIAKDVQSPL